MQIVSLGDNLHELPKPIFLIFSQKIDFDILCKLSPLETVCMNCQSLFSGKIKKKNYILKLSSAEIFTEHAKSEGVHVYSCIVLFLILLSFCHMKFEYWHVFLILNDMLAMPTEMCLYHLWTVKAKYRLNIPAF